MRADFFNPKDPDNIFTLLFIKGFTTDEAIAIVSTITFDNSEAMP
jgi:hypothetical protein